LAEAPYRVSHSPAKPVFTICAQSIVQKLHSAGFGLRVFSQACEERLLARQMLFKISCWRPRWLPGAQASAALFERRAKGQARKAQEGRGSQGS
jgi:hypothetical protein